MRNWRVATRLNAILLIPVLVALVFGGLRVQDAVQTWQDANDAVRIAQLVQASSAYADAAINERDISVVPLLKGDTKNAQVLAARAATDRAKKVFDAAVTRMPRTSGLIKRVQVVREGEKRLAALRAAAFTRKLPGVQSEEGYYAIQHPLMELSNELGYGQSDQASFGRTLYAVSLAQAAESLTRSIGTHILVEDRGRLAPGELGLQLTAFSSYAYLQQVAIQEFQGGGTAQDVARLKTALAAAAAQGKKQITAAADQATASGRPFVAPPASTAMVEEIASGKPATKLAAEGITASSWFSASTLDFDAYRSVEVYLTDSALTDAQGVASSARTDAVVNSAVVLLALIVAFIVAALMARSMSRSTRRLRNAALEIAELRLPALVDQLSRPDPGRIDTRVQAIPINSKDEIGEVARAFDQVHREAVRLAAEQSLLRSNVNAIFTNLSRRNQGLIKRQLTLITEMENSEAEPDQLENLFKMDHLATRMRRNGENLLVLAGEEPGRRWNQPVPLVDVLRAAASEVESYARIELIGIPEIEIRGTAVTDLVHLLAELLENATTFSSPQTKVRVTATRLPDGRVVVEIHDKGIGLTAEDFADINHRLAEPPTVDASVSERMGLFVVGRLADRHGIRIQLRPSGEEAGTTSLVTLPEPITHGGGGEEQLQDDNEFTVSRIVPEHDAAAVPYQPSAADLGFDDSRYEEGRKPDDARALDPVGRSLKRKDRRARLESAADGRTGGQPMPAPLGDVPEQHSYEAPYETGYPQQGYAGPVGRQDQGEWQQQGYPVPAQSARQEWPELAPYDPLQLQPPQQAESAPGGSFQARERVGFDGLGPVPSASHSLTDSGLPRRDRGGREQPAGAAQRAPDQEESTQWRSTNDDNWQRAEQAREPKAGGVTPSGLPRRVPKANLVAGAAQQTPQSGPQVSRAPEEIRGRLSNLRRGVQQGRSAGTDTNGQGFGPNHQER